MLNMFGVSGESERNYCERASSIFLTTMIALYSASCGRINYDPVSVVNSPPTMVPTTMVPTTMVPPMVDSPHCSDGITNFGESDVDCGGPCGPTCNVGQACTAPQDCAMALCTSNVCQIETGVPTWQNSTLGSAENVSLNAISTSTQVSASPNALYLAVISVKPSRSVDSLTGLGLTWSPIRQQCGGRDTAQLSMYWARGAAPVSSVITANLNNGTPFTGSAVIAVHSYSGVDSPSPIGATSWANTVGTDSSALCAGGTDSSAYAWNTLNVEANSIVFVGAHTARYTHTPGVGYTERSDDQSGNAVGSAGVAVEDRFFLNPSLNIDVQGSFSNLPDWAVIAVELRN